MKHCKKQTSVGILWFLLLIALFSLGWMYTYHEKVLAVEAEQVQLQEIQAQHETFFHLLSENLKQVDIAYWQYEYDTGIVSWSSKLFEIFGMEEMPIDYDTWLATIHPDDREHADRLCAEKAELGESSRMVYRIITPTGEVRRVLKTACADPEQRFMVGVVILLQDHEEVGNEIGLPGNH